jgi:hypothetical protein
MFSFFKKKKKIPKYTREQTMLNLAVSKNEEYRAHVIRDCGGPDEDDELHFQMDRDKIKELSAVLFPKDHYIHHGACLSCTAPRELGITVCLGCSMLNRNSSIDLSEQYNDKTTKNK